MPRFDSSGRIVSGTGSGVVAVNGEVIAHGGVANWLAPGQVIFQNSADDKLYIYDAHTPAKPPVMLTPPNGGANALAAGGGRWIAWLAGTGLYGPSGLIDGAGRLAGVSMEQDGRGAASAQGHIAITDNENQGFKIIGLNGEVTLEVTGTYALSMHVLNGTTAVWVDERNRPRAVGLPDPDVPAMPLYAIRAVQVSGVFYVLAGTNDGLILYPWHDASHGWKYAGDAFYPTAFVRDNSLVSIAFATGAGETPESLRVWNVNVDADAKVPLRPSAPTPTPEPPTPSPDPEPVPMPEIPAELNDQRALVSEVRNTLYPGMEGRPLNSNAKAFQITKHVAWRLRHLGIGLVRAKAGSDNNVEGYTSDVIALKSGAHWDVLQAAEESAFPSWDLVPEQHWPAVAPRWAEPVNPGGGLPVPPVDPQPQPQPNPDTGAPAWARQLIADVAAIRQHFR